MVEIPTQPNKVLISICTLLYYIPSLYFWVYFTIPLTKIPPFFPSKFYPSSSATLHLTTVVTTAVLTSTSMYCKKIRFLGYLFSSLLILAAGWFDCSKRKPMLVIIGILLIFGLVVRHKWRNGAAKKEEILRLAAVASEEELNIAKLQAIEEYNSPPHPQTQLENQYCCAVCRCPTTTRCSRCKAVRYWWVLLCLRLFRNWHSFIGCFVEFDTLSLPCHDFDFGIYVLEFIYYLMRNLEILLLIVRGFKFLFELK